jgi:hypothetical protein
MFCTGLIRNKRTSLHEMLVFRVLVFRFLRTRVVDGILDICEHSYFAVLLQWLFTSLNVWSATARGKKNRRRSTCTQFVFTSCAVLFRGPVIVDHRNGNGNAIIGRLKRNRKTMVIIIVTQCARARVGMVAAKSYDIYDNMHIKAVAGKIFDRRR